MKVTSTWGGLEGDLSSSPGLWAIEIDGVPIVGIDFAYCGEPADKRDMLDKDPIANDWRIVIGYWDMNDDEWRRLHEIPMKTLRGQLDQQRSARREMEAWSLVSELANLGNDRDKFELIRRARTLLEETA